MALLLWLCQCSSDAKLIHNILRYMWCRKGLPRTNDRDDIQQKKNVVPSSNMSNQSIRLLNWSDLCWRRGWWLREWIKDRQHDVIIIWICIGIWQRSNINQAPQLVSCKFIQQTTTKLLSITGWAFQSNKKYQALTLLSCFCFSDDNNNINVVCD